MTLSSVKCSDPAWQWLAPRLMRVNGAIPQCERALTKYPLPDVNDGSLVNLIELATK